jgi:hypothetical protein
MMQAEPGKTGCLFHAHVYGHVHVHVLVHIHGCGPFFWPTVSGPCLGWESLRH